MLQRLIETCDDSLTGHRDRVLLQLGYETLRRRSELVAFRFDDLVKTPAGTTRLLLRRSKTDQFGAGKQLPLSNGLVEAILDWKSTLSGRSEFIICKINQGQPANAPMPPQMVNRILRMRQAKAGIELEHSLSGHSFRVGGALDLLKRGVPIEKIMLRGGWKSESTALRYLQEWVDDE